MRGFALGSSLFFVRPGMKVYAFAYPMGTIGQRLAMVQNDPAPADFAEKAIAYAETKMANLHSAAGGDAGIEPISIGPALPSFTQISQVLANVCLKSSGSSSIGLYDIDEAGRIFITERGGDFHVRVNAKTNCALASRFLFPSGAGHFLSFVPLRKYRSWLGFDATVQASAFLPQHLQADGPTNDFHREPSVCLFARNLAYKAITIRFNSAQRLGG